MSFLWAVRSVPAGGPLSADQPSWPAGEGQGQQPCLRQTETCPTHSRDALPANVTVSFCPALVAASNDSLMTLPRCLKVTGFLWVQLRKYVYL